MIIDRLLTVATRGPEVLSVAAKGATTKEAIRPQKENRRA